MTEQLEHGEDVDDGARPVLVETGQEVRFQSVTKLYHRVFVWILVSVH